MILFLERVKIITFQCFLEECKYAVKEKKIPKHIIDDIEISSDPDRENFDEETSDEENSDEENLKNTNETHILKFIFESCEKYFYNFFCLHIKTVNYY